MSINKTLTATLAVALSVTVASCGGNKNNAENPESVAVTPAQTLIAQLDSVVKSGRFYFGHDVAAQCMAAAASLAFPFLTSPCDPRSYL